MKNVAREQSINNLEELKQYALDLSVRLASRQILLLNGPMGAGKTQFTRFLLEALGSDEVVSPSFSIHNRYDTKRGPVDHIDLYRLENEDELESTGFWDLFSAKQGLIIIEWAERLRPDMLPVTWDRLAIKIEFEIEVQTSARKIIEDRR